MSRLPVGLFAVLLSGLGLMLSGWVVIPAPIAPLLPLAVVAPEISPWLAGINLLGFGLGAYRLAAGGGGGIAMGVSAIALGLSLMPILQFPAAQQSAEAAFTQAFGSKSLNPVPAFQLKMRPQPFVWADLWRGIPISQVRTMAGVEFANPAGVPLVANIYQPPKAGLYPTIVLLYGGAWQRGTPQDNATLASYLAAQGYVVWAVDYRHAPEHQFPAQLQDVRAALNFIQTCGANYESDAGRVALLGKSAGAHLAMLAAYQPDSLPVRGVVNYYGPVDLLNGYTDLPRPDPLQVQSVLESFLGGTPNDVGKTYLDASPSTYIRPGLPPTLLVYGHKDHIVMFKFGQQLLKSLQAQGNAAALVALPWSDHAFDAVFRGLGNQLALYYTERFLAQVLYGQSDQS